jgi:hypothetical protein
MEASMLLVTHQVAKTLVKELEFDIEEYGTLISNFGSCNWVLQNNETHATWLLCSRMLNDRLLLGNF